jgi:hypothetical protein
MLTYKYRKKQQKFEGILKLVPVFSSMIFFSMESYFRYLRKHEKRVLFTQDVVLIQEYFHYSTSPTWSLVSKILYNRSQILGSPTGNIEKYRESLVILQNLLRTYTLK